MFSCSLPDREDVSTDYPQRLCFRALTGNLQLLVLKRVKNLRILLPSFACTFKIPYGYNSDTHFLFYTTSSNLEFSVREKFIIGRVTVVIYSVSQKNPPCGLRFSGIFDIQIKILNQFFTHLLYIPIKFLFSYLKL